MDLYASDIDVKTLQDWDMKSAGITCSERTYHINWHLLENV